MITTHVIAIDEENLGFVLPSEALEWLGVKESDTLLLAVEAGGTFRIARPCPELPEGGGAAIP